MRLAWNMFVTSAARQAIKQHSRSIRGTSTVLKLAAPIRTAVYIVTTDLRFGLRFILIANGSTFRRVPVLHTCELQGCPFVRLYAFSERLSQIHPQQASAFRRHEQIGVLFFC